VSEALEGGATSLVGVWQRAPLQAIARLHALAAADLADDDRLGRPGGDAEVGRRLALLADIVTGGTMVPAPVLAAVVHGELLTLEPFGTADGVVARAVSRLVTIASGLDPHGLGVPEVYWMRHSGDYRAAARGFASGTPDGLRAWLVLSARALHAGAREALLTTIGTIGRRVANARWTKPRLNGLRRPSIERPPSGQSMALIPMACVVSMSFLSALADARRSLRFTSTCPER